MCACIKLASSGLKDFPKFGGKPFLAATKPSKPCPRSLIQWEPNRTNYAEVLTSVPALCDSHTSDSRNLYKSN